MAYEPEYAKGQILVCFKIDCGKEFARDFGRALGHELSDEDYDYGDGVFFMKQKKGRKGKLFRNFKP